MNKYARRKPIISTGPDVATIYLPDGTMGLLSYNKLVACQTIDGNYYRTSMRLGFCTKMHIMNWLNGKQAEVKDQEYFDKLRRAA